ncbi:MAG: prepilin-type N-terminal cleavage/methylation domain-containing protein [Patescibacteria group bacterium]
MLEKCLFKLKDRKGFTLIELLIVIAIIAIIASVVFVALDPLTRFREARDTNRWSNIASILNAIKVDQVDNRGSYLSAISNMTSGLVYMIVDGAVSSGCDDQNAYCDTDVSGDSNCVNLAGLVNEGYLGDVPVSPNGLGTWSSSITGYTLTASSSGIISVRACESENSDEIWLAK